MTGKERVRTLLNQSREVSGGIPLSKKGWALVVGPCTPLFGGPAPRRAGWVEEASLGLDQKIRKEVIAGKEELGIKRLTTLNLGGELK